MAVQETKKGEIRNYRVSANQGGPFVTSAPVDQWTIVMQDPAGGQNDVMTDDGSAAPLGIAVEKSDKGSRIDVQRTGVSIVRLVAAVAQGDLIKSDGAGLGDVGAAGDMIIGVADEPGVAGQLISVRMNIEVN